MWDWSELQPEIIQMISLRIDNPFDLIHFRSVCSWWRSSSIPKFRPVPSLRCPLPPDLVNVKGDCHIIRIGVYLIKSLSHDPPQFWLFKLQEEENGSLAIRCFFSRTTSGRECSQHPTLSLDLLNSQVIELAQEHVICYTTSRWPEFVDPISLMLLGEENKEFMIVKKLSLRGLSIYRSFEERWTEIETTPGGHTESIASFNGQLYAIGHTGVTKVVKPTLELNSFQRSRQPCDNTVLERWFVKSEDKLLLVEMCIENHNVYYTPALLAEKGWFEISELNKERNDWIQVEDLGGRVLFLDYDRSFICLPNHVPGFRPNSIVFPASSGRVQSFHVFEFGQQGFNLWEISPSIFRFCYHNYG